MAISDNLRQYLASECRTVAERMRLASTATDRLYLFSAVFGASQRVFNIEFEREFVHLHIVSLWVHQALVQRDGFEAGPRIPEGALERLADLVGELGDRIEAAADYADLVEEMATLGYAGTGNGLYLAMTGRLQ